MKQNYDKHHRELYFQGGDCVYVCLQPYPRTSVSHRKDHKLAPKYYGPLRIVKRIGAVTHKLDLPAIAKIHPIFHIFALKQKLEGIWVLVSSCGHVSRSRS